MLGMLETYIAGIPCTIRIDSVTGRYLAARIHADPDDCYEAEYPDVEFTVCDRNGRPAPWLHKKLTMDEGMRIEEEILESMT